MLQAMEIVMAYDKCPCEVTQLGDLAGEGTNDKLYRHTVSLYSSLYTSLECIVFRYNCQGYDLEDSGPTGSRDVAKCITSTYGFFESAFFQ